MNASLEIQICLCFAQLYSLADKVQASWAGRSGPRMTIFGCLILAGRRTGESEMFVPGIALR
jgi:hypothetical protein